LIHFLGQTKDSRAIGPLAEALEGSGTNVAHHVSKALSNFGDAGCEALIKVLEQGPINQRDDAARALGWMDNQRATVPLIKAVAWYRENKDFVPSSFFWALGMLEDKRSVETLIEALQYTRDYTRRRVADALERITGESFGEDRVKWLEWWNKVKQSSCKDGA
jgi:HEAT repeat protein